MHRDEPRPGATDDERDDFAERVAVLIYEHGATEADARQTAQRELDEKERMF